MVSYKVDFYANHRGLSGYFFFITTFYFIDERKLQNINSCYIRLIFRIDGKPNLSRRIAPRASLGNIVKLSYTLTF